MKKTRKLLLVALLMFLVAAATGGAYGYWAGQINAPAEDTDDINITIGKGMSVSTELNVTDPADPTAQKLVPADQKKYSDDSINCVEFMEFEHKVKWTTTSGGSVVGATGTLTMLVTGKTIGDGEDAASLGGTYVKVQVWDPAANAGSGAYTDVDTLTYAIVPNDANHVSVKIKVTLLEPANKADYDKIATKAMKVSLSFNVTPGT